ncbi:MAG: ABC-ATPase UvrA [Oligoflexus sp.]
MKRNEHPPLVEASVIDVRGAREHNLQDINLQIERNAITVITGVSGSGKSSLAFDTILAEAQRRFFYTLSHYTRQFLDLGTRPSVGSIQGLSPAIALAQNETQPSVRATVGTLTDVSELFGVLFARFAEKNCPTHNLPTAQLAIETVMEQILAGYHDQSLAIVAPVVEKKRGAFQKQLSAFAEKGYLRALIDGELVSLSPIPELAKDQKHDISILVDLIKIDEKRSKRLLRSLQTALDLGNGLGEYFPMNADAFPQLAEARKFSLKDGCPECGYSWPKLDSRYFSINSLGACQSCRGLGYLKIETDDDWEESSSIHSRICRSCQGTGLRRELEAIRFFGLSPQMTQQLSIQELQQQIQARQQQAATINPACQRVLEQIQNQLDRMVHVGLGYLCLSRRVRSLSGGEAQRLRLSGVLGENLRGVLYVLDEPSQGLSAQEIATIWPSLVSLKEAGNTLIIVDHDENIMRRADWIIDLGPGGGRHGGKLVAKFKPQDAKDYRDISLTAKFLARKKTGNQKTRKKFRPAAWLEIQEPRLFNLKMQQVRIPLSAITLVGGVSGSGKSTLSLAVLYHNLEGLLKDPKKPQLHYCKAIKGWQNIEKLVLINRKPIAKTSVSMPATYLDVFGDIRNLFAKLPEAQIAGLTNRSFSLSVDAGRCPECKGKGYLSLSMKFLSDAKVVCPVCDGRRYQPQVLDVRYKSHSIADILDLTMEEALEVFANHPKILKKLRPAADLGLGYLKLGQPSSHLSGGESQRLKLAPLLTKDIGKGTLVILDEPTRGLHFQDVERLKAQLTRMREQEATILLIEHNQDLFEVADWLVELGPGSAENGGNLIFEGLVQDHHGDIIH